MIDIKDKFEKSWFCRRFCALVVDFPLELNPNKLRKDDVCSDYDAEDAYVSLKLAHEFLAGIANELLLPKQDKSKWDFVERVFSKFDLIWSLFFFGELHLENNEYCFYINKSLLKTKINILPANYSSAFQNISDHGCYVEYFKNDKPVKDYKSCNMGVLHFDNRLTALGLYLFIKKVTQKKWYSESDKAGGYAKGSFKPIKHCIQPYYRIDMRIFICGDRMRYDILEQMAGYNDKFIGYFKTIYNFVHNNYPDCLPIRGIFGYINCSVTFGVDTEHRMIGQLGVGQNEDKFGFYGALTNKEMDTMLANIDLFSEKIVMQFLHNTQCECDLCKNKIGELVYRNIKYNRVYKNTENRFSIENEDDVQQAIKVIDIKAKCNMNTRTK